MMAACRIVSCATPATSVRNRGNCCSSSSRVSTSLQSPCRLVVSQVRTKASGRAEAVVSRGPWPILATSRNFRLKVTVSVSTSSPGEVSVPSPSSGEQREELKAKLVAAIDAADGNLNEECVNIINELAKVNPNVGVLEGEEGRKLWVGAFEGVKAGFKGSGKKGGGKEEVGYRGAPATLGRLAFNVFKPADLNVFISAFFNCVYEDPQGGYLLITCFTFDNPRGPNLPAVDGFIFSRASYNNVGPDKQEVVFQSSLIKPRFPERDLEVWKEVFGENPGMDDEGKCSGTLPDYKGALDYLYVDEELRITKGNHGAHVVVRKLPELNPELKPPS